MLSVSHVVSLRQIALPKIRSILYYTVALRAAQSVEQPNKWHKSYDKGKGKGKKG